jgi:D-lactate dehydrogenase (cytochrome)
VGAGLTLAELDEHLRGRGRRLPSAPTYAGASVGGMAATNAAGASTFKYGTTRDWVDGLTVVLAQGEVLDLVRGEVVADLAGFEIDTTRGVLAVPVIPLAMPDVPKRSAGYHLAPGMDLVDLFVGSEGTLGTIVDVTWRTAPIVPVVSLIVTVPDEGVAIDLVGRLREASRETWARDDRSGLDVAAIEHVDARALALLREEGEDRRLGMSWPPGTAVVLLVRMELRASKTDADVVAELESALEPSGATMPLGRMCRLLDQSGVLDTTEVVLPHDRAGLERVVAFREAVPDAVNRRIGRVQQAIDSRIHKTAGDVIVPYARFRQLMDGARAIFARHHLDVVTFGHISDANVHPNVLPRSVADVERGAAALLELGQLVIDLGGCPMAEHGVGRHPVKQALLERLYGREGVEAMRRVKRALDPTGKLARGVVFSPEPAGARVAPV